MAEAVIGRALLRVLQRLVGFVDFLELVLAGVVAGIAVRVELHGELAESRLELLLVRALLRRRAFRRNQLSSCPAARMFNVLAHCLTCHRCNDWLPI